MLKVEEICLISILSFLIFNINCFSGMAHIQFIREITENMFHIIKKYFYHSTSLYIQTGAIFLLFALYAKQPIKDFIKIRLTRDDYSKLIQCVELSMSKNEHEMPYKFCELKAMNAFYYVADRQLRAPELEYLKPLDNFHDDTFDKNAAETLIEKCENFKELCNTKELADIDIKYSEASKKCAQKNPQMLFIESTILKDIEKAQEDIKNFNIATGNTDCNKKLLKDKAFSAKTALYRGEKEFAAEFVLKKEKMEKPESPKY